MPVMDGGTVAQIRPLPIELATAEDQGFSISDEERQKYTNFYATDEASLLHFEALPAAVRALLDEPYDINDEQVKQYKVHC